MVEINDLGPDQGRGRVETTLAELAGRIVAAGGNANTPLELGTDGEPLYITAYPGSVPASGQHIAAVGIVQLLARSNAPMRRINDHPEQCMLCRVKIDYGHGQEPELHAPLCPWRLAREWEPGPRTRAAMDGET